MLIFTAIFRVVDDNFLLVPSTEDNPSSATPLDTLTDGVIVNPAVTK